jgi:hypothetical protein
MMLRDVNRNPRRWVDDSGRVRVIEGWHPALPCEVGYNVKVDGDWLGTFQTLASAAEAAAAHEGKKDRKVVLRPYPRPSRSRGKVTDNGLHLVPPTPADDA